MSCNGKITTCKHSWCNFSSVLEWRKLEDLKKWTANNTFFTERPNVWLFFKNNKAFKYFKWLQFRNVLSYVAKLCNQDWCPKTSVQNFVKIVPSTWLLLRLHTHPKTNIFFSYLQVRGHYLLRSQARPQNNRFFLISKYQTMTW